MIRHSLAALVAICIGTLAQADMWAVTGVASNDTLNVRAGPSTRFGVVEKLEPQAGRLEKEVCVLVKPSPNVLASTSHPEWCAISRGGEMLGWVNARYLTRHTDAATLPVMGAVDGFPGCWFVGENALTASYLDHSARLVGCQPGSAGHGRIPGQFLDRISGLDLFSVAQ